MTLDVKEFIKNNPPPLNSGTDQWTDDEVETILVEIQPYLELIDDIDEESKEDIISIVLSYLGSMAVIAAQKEFGESINDDFPRAIFSHFGDTSTLAVDVANLDDLCIYIQKVEPDLCAIDELDPTLASATLKSVASLFIDKFNALVEGTEDTEEAVLDLLLTHTRARIRLGDREVFSGEKEVPIPVPGRFTPTTLDGLVFRFAQHQLEVNDNFPASLEPVRSLSLAHGHDKDSAETISLDAISRLTLSMLIEHQLKYSDILKGAKKYLSVDIDVNSINDLVTIQRHINGSLFPEDDERTARDFYSELRIAYSIHYSDLADTGEAGEAEAHMKMILRTLNWAKAYGYDIGAPLYTMAHDHVSGSYLTKDIVDALSDILLESEIEAKESSTYPELYYLVKIIDGVETLQTAPIHILESYSQGELK